MLPGLWVPYIHLYTDSIRVQWVIEKNCEEEMKLGEECGVGDLVGIGGWDKGWE